MARLIITEINETERNVQWFQSNTDYEIIFLEDICKVGKVTASEFYELLETLGFIDNVKDFMSSCIEDEEDLEHR